MYMYMMYVTMYTYMYELVLRVLFLYLCYSFQDVDQASGEDLNPVVNRMLVGGEVKDAKARNPDRYS